MNLRIDRAITLYAVGPLRRLLSAFCEGVPILMYHSISEKNERGVHGYYQTATSPQVFSEQLQYLYANGYQTCGLEEVTEHPIADSHKRVVITFDDGYADFYRQAFPVMNQYGFGATVFLPTAYIAEGPMRFKQRECLTWAEIRELQRLGVVFGSHTVSHPQLRDLSAQAIDKELSMSKQRIEEKTGYAVKSFAYPFAFPQTDCAFIGQVRESLLRAGYENGVCTMVGRASRKSDRLFLERLPINSRDDRRLFAAKLAGAYDWIRVAQYLKKSWGNRNRKSGRGEEKLALTGSARCKC